MSSLVAGGWAFPSFTMLVLWFAAYSFGGWVWETVLCSVSARTFVRRGFLFGPYLPIYGFGAVCVLVFVGWIANPVMLFFAGLAVCSALEYFTSWLLEKLFHHRWWDYSERPLNINGRICLLSMTVFGAFSVGLVELLNPLVVQAGIDLLPSDVQTIVAACLLTMFLLDAMISSMRHSGRESRVTFSDLRGRVQTVLPGTPSELRVRLQTVLPASPSDLVQMQRRRLDVTIRNAADDVERARRRALGKGALRREGARKRLGERLRELRDRAA